MYSCFVVPPIFKWGNVPLTCLVILFYLLLALVIYDYLQLTCTDPVDPSILEDQHYPDDNNVKKCSICQLQV